MFRYLRQLWHSEDLRKRILITLFLLFIYRLVAHITVPGTDPLALKDFLGTRGGVGAVGIFAALTGGAIDNFSVVMLGLSPYINASIIMQLSTVIFPKLEAISKEGAQGQQQINRYTRFLTLPLAALQGYSFITLMQRQGGGQLIGDLTSFQWISAIITVTAGTVFLMWLGELMSEKKIGNGISLLIFAGIIASLPSAVQRLIATFDATQAFNLLIFLGIAIVTIVVVVIITEGQRNIPVNYARRVRGNRMYGGVNTHLPLRVNMAGVIPIIFAISIILIPPMIAQFFVSATTPWVAGGARFVVNLFQNQVFYGLFYFIMVFAFTYFYTFVVFHPHQIAENLQKQGGFIPGIRPGRHTADYLQKTANKILLAGALFLGLIAVLPIIIQPITGISSLAIGGTSLLIVVAVVIELVKQIDSQLTMRDYDGL